LTWIDRVWKRRSFDNPYISGWRLTAPEHSNALADAVHENSMPLLPVGESSDRWVELETGKLNT